MRIANRLQEQPDRRDPRVVEECLHAILHADARLVADGDDRAETQAALDERGVTARVRGIADTLGEVWRRARTEGAPPHRIADRIVEERLGAARAAQREGT